MKVMFRSIRYRARSILSRFPSIYLPLARIRHRRQDIVVCPETDLVIEGYPRSGNTFAVMAFQMAQPAPLRIAHHLHSVSQVIAARKWGVPSLVLIRNPRDAIISLLIRHPHIKIQQALYDYCRFYETLLRYRADIVIVPFDQVIADFGKAIDGVNGKFNRDFKQFDHSPEYAQLVFTAIEERNKELYGRGKVNEDMVARPSSRRSHKKESLQTELNQAHVRPILERANAVFEKFSRVI